MLFVGMKNATTHNDNEDTWASIAAVTAKLVSKLDEKHREERTDNRGEQERREGDEKAKSEYVERRLRDLAQFETRARGGRRS